MEDKTYEHRAYESLRSWMNRNHPYILGDWLEEVWLPTELAE